MCAIRNKSLLCVGKRFNRLTCTNVYWDINSNSTHGEFLCECGSTYTGNLASVKFGNTKSCGCLNRELISSLKYSHGMANTLIYGIWAEMRARCQRPSHSRFKDYGGRGISVSESWISFDTFYKDMGDRPPGQSLERMDNDKGYSKGNCVWATQTTQNINKRNNNWIEAFNIRLPITWWGTLIGMGSSELGKKLLKENLEDVIVARFGSSVGDKLCLG